MRGLPPPPTDVLRIQADWDIGSAGRCTTSWYILAPGSWTATSTQLETLLGDFFLGPANDLLSIVGTDVTIGVLRLSTYGPGPQVIQVVPAFNVGAVGTTNPLNGAAVLTWRAVGPRGYLLGHTFLPLSDSFVDNDHVTIRAVSWSQLQAAARLFVQHVAGIASPDGGQCVLVVLQRSEAGAPLIAAQVAPVDLGDASPFVGTLRRRVHMRRPSSTPI